MRNLASNIDHDISHAGMGQNLGHDYLILFNSRAQDARQYYVLDTESTEDIKEDWVSRFFKAAEGDGVDSSSDSSSSEKPSKRKNKGKKSPKKKSGKKTNGKSKKSTTSKKLHEASSAVIKSEML